MRTAVLVLDYPCRGILGFADVLFYVIAFVYHAPDYAWHSLRRLVYAIQNDDSKLIETCVALFCFLPGCWMLPGVVEGRRWDVLLASVMPLAVYGWALVMAGLLIATGLHFDLLFLRRVGQAAAFLIWFYLLLFFFIEFRNFLVVPLIPPICAMALRSYWVLGRQSNGPTRRHEPTP